MYRIFREIVNFTYPLYENMVGISCLCPSSLHVDHLIHVYITVLCHVMRCNLVDRSKLSEEYAASILRLE